MRPSPGLMWGTATLMVTIVSCCSLIGVSIMPLISGPSYKTFITLFTGLAVGSLLGSAIFSLIPQAFSLHLTTDKTYLWKSLIIFFGIYLFYCSERLMRMYFDRKARKKEQQTHLKRNKSAAGLTESTGGDEVARLAEGDNGPNTSNEVGDLTKINVDKNQVPDSANKIYSGQTLAQQGQDHHNHSHHHHGSANPFETITKALKGSSREVIARNKTEIAPLAWMIIIGDGLHNFIDGLSIGAAFSESIILGVSTSVAVIFEEFPHELGDFAVLIHSRMTVRQALGFNFLSACTCYIGMVFGILLGDTTSSASFIFALAAGMFLYISLVDMMGELNAVLEECKDSTRDTAQLLLMQNVGILSGIIIIFTLSFFGDGAVV